jgi:Leucine-rich repeat (LRR) protein
VEGEDKQEDKKENAKTDEAKAEEAKAEGEKQEIKVAEEEVQNNANKAQEDQVDLDEYAGIKNCLTLEMISQNLDNISRTPDGLSCVYTSLNLNKQKLEHLGNALLLFKHLRYITLNHNKLTDISFLSKLPHLCTIDASNNLIENIDFLSAEDNSFQFLKLLKLSNNKITKLPHLNPPYLQAVHLNGNFINDCSGYRGHPQLTVMDLSKNMLETCDGIHKMPLLQELYLADMRKETKGEDEEAEGASTLRSFSELKELPKLRKLHLGNSAVMDLGNCPDLPSLQDLNLIGTPLEERFGDDFKKEVLILLEKLPLKKLNDEDITEEDIQDAKQLKEDRIKEEEEKRREAELAAQEAEGDNEDK